jgi:hypothetical protein
MRVSRMTATAAIGGAALALTLSAWPGSSVSAAPRPAAVAAATPALAAATLALAAATSAPAAATLAPAAATLALTAATPAPAAVTAAAAATVKPALTPRQAWNAAGGRRRDQKVMNDISSITNYSVAGLDNADLRVAVWKLYADTQRVLANPPPHAAAFVRAMSELHAAATARSDAEAVNDMINGTSDLPAWVLTSTH